MLNIDLGVVGIVIGVCLTFGGMLLSNKFTGFGASPQGLGVVSLMSVLLSMIPSYGFLVSLIATFFMLKYLSKEGVILMMIVSWIMMFFIIIGIGKIL